MAIPPPVQDAIDGFVRAVPARALERAARELSESYRAGGATASRAARTATDVAAYLVTRAPATFAAVEDVLVRLRAARPGFAPSSLLDLGAGPGVATWAATATWPEIVSATLVEAEAAMRQAGERIGCPVEAARWRTALPAGERADLVVASYLLGELTDTELAPLVESAWAAARDTLVVVEPGTTAGYRRILAVRDAVVARGGHVVAPCPHSRACPLPEGDWCHFGVRLARSGAHRRAKGAERGFEDEKLSYVALCRTPAPLPEARVLRRPEQRPGHVLLDLCTDAGLERRTVSKKQGDAYRRARKLAWGDALR